jgi:hypothetical protein
MITSKQIVDLTEEYFTSKNVSGHNVLIFKNPSYDDIRELKGTPTFQVRFIADELTKTFYIWDANLAIHYPIIAHLGYNINACKGNTGTALMSQAMIQGDKLVLTHTQIDDMFYFPSLWMFKRQDANATQMLNQLLACDWRFVDKYISGFSQQFNLFKQLCQKFLSTRRP